MVPALQGDRCFRRGVGPFGVQSSGPLVNRLILDIPASLLCTLSGHSKKPVGFAFVGSSQFWEAATQSPTDNNGDCIHGTCSASVCKGSILEVRRYGVPSNGLWQVPLCISDMQVLGLVLQRFL